MIGAQQAHEAVAQQLLAVEARSVQVGVIADRQIDFAILHRTHHFTGCQRHRIQRAVRRLTAHAVQDAGQEHEFAHVRQRHGQVSRVARRIEAVGNEEVRLQPQQHRARARGQRMRARRRRHPGRGLDEQRLAQAATQAAERTAHRRLTDPEALRRTADAARLIDREQHAQQVEVEVVQAHAAPKGYRSSQ